MIYEPQRRREDSFRNRVLGFFKWFFIIAGVCTSLSILSVILTVIWPPRHVTATPDKFILTYTFKGGLAEVAGGPSLSAPLLHEQPLGVLVVDFTVGA